MSVRESTFTLRIEPALRRMAERQKSVRVAAMSTGIPIGDVRLWIAEFNDGKEELTLARLNEVKHELGILKVSERPAKPEKHTERLESEPAVLQKETKGTKIEPKAAPDSARNELVRPWHDKNRKACAKGAARWLPVLQLFLVDAEVNPRAVRKKAKEIGMTPGNWWAFRNAFFGSADGCNRESVTEFLAAFGPKADSTVPEAKVRVESEPSTAAPAHPHIEPLSEDGQIKLDAYHALLKLGMTPGNAKMRIAAAVEKLGVHSPERWSAADVVRIACGGQSFVKAAPVPEPIPKSEGGDSAPSFGEALAEVELLAGVYRDAQHRNAPCRHIRGGLALAMAEAAALVTKEASE